MLKKVSLMNPYFLRDSVVPGSLIDSPSLWIVYATCGVLSCSTGQNHHIWTCSIFENRICGVKCLLKYHELTGFFMKDSLRLDKLKYAEFLGRRRRIGLLSTFVSVRMISVNFGDNNLAVTHHLALF